MLYVIFSICELLMNTDMYFPKDNEKSVEHNIWRSGGRKWDQLVEEFPEYFCEVVRRDEFAWKKLS